MTDRPLRIGTDERTAAMKALDEHLAAGRLGVEEYADRSAAVSAATLSSELAALFTDLPAPHPQLPGTAAAPVLPRTEQLPVVPDAGPVDRAGGFLEGWGPRIVAVTPIVALLLFFVTQQWWWFLLVPLAGALVYGGGIGRNDGERSR